MSRIARLKGTLVLLFGLILVLSGCSKQNSKSLIDSDTGKHSTADWANADTHGAWAKKSSSDGGFASCQECHGNDFAGGNSRKTCLNTDGCHGAAINSPHPGAWASASGARTHQTTDQSNATVCADCHTNGALSPLGALTTPAPAGTAPGCYNNTLCHGEGHAAGWAAADQHGATAKATASGFSGCESCHGAGFIGSGSAPTCLNNCHGVAAGAAVNAPHASPWKTTSTYKHSTTNEGNAAVCFTCHEDGLNSSVTPSPAAPNGTAAGCYNNTLCHGEGHAAGWAAADQHGASAKAANGFSGCQSCHGVDFSGSGSATTSCLNNCHGVAAGAAVDAPHASPWRSDSPTYKHSTTNEGNAPECALCHLGQGMSAPATTPIYIPLPGGTTVAGCSDGQICHPAGSVGCVGCHASIQDAPNASTASGGAVTQRDNIVAEFASTWSHKRAASGVVTDEDCVVCHMEGDAATKTRDIAYHGNGYIELRDPDLDGTIKQVSFSGTPGSYTSTGTDARPVRFSRNLNSTTIETDTAAMQINFCLKCHDAVGAENSNARVTGGTALKPFNTTVASTSTYYLNSVAAGNAAGSVVDVNTSFDSNNASYHPVSGKQNNGYIGNARLKGPWTALSPDKTAGGTTTYGYLISCWDCHAPAGTASTVTLTRTVTAHGGTSTIRADYHIAATTGTPNLCTYCHIDTYFTGGTNHGTGSAFGTGGSSSRYTIGNCATCHGSSNDSRPWRGVDAHGFNQWAELRTDTVTPANSLKSGPTTATGHRPYAFIRTGNLAHVNPLSVPAGDGTWTPAGYNPGCVRSSTFASGYSCGNSHATTGPGGAF